MFANSMRARRIGDQIRRELALVIARDVADPRVSGVMVSDLEISKDLAHARVYIVVPQGESPEECLAGLQSASGFLRRHIAKAVRMRQVPTLNFRIDTTLDTAAHMDALIASALPALPADDPDGDKADDDGSETAESDDGGER